MCKILVIIINILVKWLVWKQFNELGWKVKTLDLNLRSFGMEGLFLPNIKRLCKCACDLRAARKRSISLLFWARSNTNLPQWTLIRSWVCGAISEAEREIDLEWEKERRQWDMVRERKRSWQIEQEIERAIERGIDRHIERETSRKKARPTIQEKREEKGC